MKMRSLTIVAALALVFALSLGASAQGRDHGGDRGGGGHSQSDRGRGGRTDRQSDHNRTSDRGSRGDSTWSRDRSDDRSQRDANSRDRSDNRSQRDGNWSRDRSNDRPQRDSGWSTRDDRGSHTFSNRNDGHSDRGSVFPDRRPDVVDRSWNREPAGDWRHGDEHFGDRYCNVRFFHDRPFVEYIGERSDWNDIAVFCGFVGLMGYLDHDDFLCFAGTSGALYAMWRYDEDIACGDPYRHARACYFSMPFFYRDGVRFERHIVLRDGVRYYQFVRC